jgi:hypothetical protein
MTAPHSMVLANRTDDRRILFQAIVDELRVPQSGRDAELALTPHLWLAAIHVNLFICQFREKQNDNRHDNQLRAGPRLHPVACAGFLSKYARALNCANEAASRRAMQKTDPSFRSLTIC